MSGKVVAIHPEVPVVAKVGPRVDKQTARLLELSAHGVPVPALISSGLGWAVWEKIKGPTLAEAARPLTFEQVDDLWQLVGHLVDRRLHVGDLRAKNIAWCPARGRWTVIDCGAIRRRSPEQVESILRQRLIVVAGL